RRPHHQQRFDLGPGAAAELGALHRVEARGARPHQVDCTRRPQIQHRLWRDRYRQHRDTDGGADAERRAAGRSLGEARATFDVKHVAEAVLYMASLPLDANVLNLTVMATKMPLV